MKREGRIRRVIDRTRIKPERENGRRRKKREGKTERERPPRWQQEEYAPVAYDALSGILRMCARAHVTS